MDREIQSVPPFIAPLASAPPDADAPARHCLAACRLRLLADSYSRDTPGLWCLKHWANHAQHRPPRAATKVFPELVRVFLLIVTSLRRFTPGHWLYVSGLRPSIVSSPPVRRDFGQSKLEASAYPSAAVSCHSSASRLHQKLLASVSHSRLSSLSSSRLSV